MSDEAKRNILVCAFKDEQKAAPVFIQNLVKELELNSVDYKLILVDDGSRDQTSFVLSGFMNAKIEMITLNRNVGKITAQAVGARKFFDGKSNLVFFDGDGQHSPSEIIKVIKYGSRNGIPAVGKRSSQYKRKNISRMGILFLRCIFRTLGISTDLQNSELLFIPLEQVKSLLSNSDFGFLPINMLFAIKETNQVLIEINPRIEEKINERTRHATSDLVRKAVIQIYSSPLRMFYRIIVLGLLPVGVMLTYGLYVGFTSLRNGDSSGVGSIIVILSFSTISLLILGLISFGFLIVINEWSRTRDVIEGELK